LFYFFQPSNKHTFRFGRRLVLRILQNEQEHEIKAVEVTSLQDISHTFSLQYGGPPVEISFNEVRIPL